MSESIGARLRGAREKRQLSLQRASDTTKIRTHYLQALENDDLSAIPSAAQARGFLRIYADFLGLQAADLVPPVLAVPSPESSEPQSTAGQAMETPAISTQARPGLLDNVRNLLVRRGRPEAVQVATQPPAPSETNGDGMGSSELPSAPLTPTKKKRRRPNRQP